MKRVCSFLLVTVVIAGLSGCSDKQKEEAARLEREMLQKDTQAQQAPADTVEVDSMAPPMDTDMGMEQESAPMRDYMPPRPAGDGYTVQVASAPTSEYAEYLVGLYEQRGYEAYITEITFNDQTYYRVRIGNFEDRPPAEALKRELADRYSLTAWIDQIAR